MITNKEDYTISTVCLSILYQGGKCSLCESYQIRLLRKENLIALLNILSYLFESYIIIPYCLQKGAHAFEISVSTRLVLAIGLNCPFGAPERFQESTCIEQEHRILIWIVLYVFTTRLSATKTNVMPLSITNESAPKMIVQNFISVFPLNLPKLYYYIFWRSIILLPQQIISSFLEFSSIISFSLLRNDAGNWTSFMKSKSNTTRPKFLPK